MNGVKATAIAIAGTSLSNLPVWLLTGLAPTIGVALGFGNVGLGSAIALFFGVAAMAALPAGTVVDRIGWRRGTIVAGAFVGTSLNVMGLADSWATLIAGLLIGSLGFAFSQPCANLALAETVTARRQGTAFGLKQASLPLTTLVVGAALPLYLGPNGWRWAFASGVGLTVLFIAVVLHAIRSRRPDRTALDKVAQRSAGTTRTWLAGSRPPAPLIVLASGSGFGSAATASLGGFLVVFSVSTGLTPADAGRLLVIGSVVCLVSRLLTGWIADRRGKRHLRVVALMMFGGSSGFACLALADRPILVVIGTVLAFGVGWAWNGLYAFAVVRVYRSAAATATGVMQAAIGTGSAVGPLAFGMVVSVASYAVAWASVAVAMAVGGTLVLLGRRMLARAAGG